MSLGNDTNVLKARMAGVRTAVESTTANRGAPQKVTHVARAEAVFVGYNDERGAARVALYFKMGDTYYAPRDTVEWCDKLLPMTDWIKEGVDARVKAAAPVTVPKEDAVDVLDDAEPEAEDGAPPTGDTGPGDVEV